MARIREDTGITGVGYGGKDTPKGIGSIGQPMAWRQATEQLGKWQSSWTDKQVLVIDSLTHVSQVIAAWCQAMNNKTNKQSHPQTIPTNNPHNQHETHSRTQNNPNRRQNPQQNPKQQPRSTPSSPS